MLLGFYQSQLHQQSVRHRRRQRPAAAARRQPDQQGRHRQRQSALEHAQHQQCGAGRQGPLHHQFPRHLQCAADRPAPPPTPRWSRTTRSSSRSTARSTRWPISPRWRRARTATSGQLAGLNDRFQTGLAQVQQYLGTTNFNNFNLQAPSRPTRPPRPRRWPFSDFTYATKQLVTNANLNNALPGFRHPTASPSAIKKGGATTNVAIDLSQVPGDAEPDQHRQLYQQPAFGGGLFHPLPEDAAGRHRHLRHQCDLRPADHAGRRRTGEPVGRLHAGALLVGNSGLATETNDHHQHRHLGRSPPRPPTRPGA